MSDQNTTGVPAAWYPDPTHTLQQRYWDGQKWTEHTAPRAPDFYPSPYHQQRSKNFALGFGIVVSIIVVVIGVMLGMQDANNKIGGAGIQKSAFQISALSSR